MKVLWIADMYFVLENCVMIIKIFWWWHFHCFMLNKAVEIDIVQNITKLLFCNGTLMHIKNNNTANLHKNLYFFIENEVCSSGFTFFTENIIKIPLIERYLTHTKIIYKCKNMCTRYKSICPIYNLKDWCILEYICIHTHTYVLFLRYLPFEQQLVWNYQPKSNLYVLFFNLFFLNLFN
jgi:hypothetical protein